MDRARVPYGDGEVMSKDEKLKTSTLSGRVELDGLSEERDYLDDIEAMHLMGPQTQRTICYDRALRTSFSNRSKSTSDHPAFFKRQK